MTDIPDARITATQVFIGGQPLPGLMLYGGVTVTPGGRDDVNQVTVTFLVGRVDIDDPTREADDE